jgi:hypothetical protein
MCAPLMVGAALLAGARRCTALSLLGDDSPSQHHAETAQRVTGCLPDQQAAAPQHQ